MKEQLLRLWNRCFDSVPKEDREAFRRDSLEKNIGRFSVLPFFNIFTQLSCIVIYLVVYPSVYPERKQIDPQEFLLYTAVYCAVNLIGVLLVLRQRRGRRFLEQQQFSERLIYALIMSYVVLESAQVAIELEISGNIYRFLATFFVVSFFPVLGRWARLLYMGTYIAISELALAYLRQQGVEVHSYREIVLLMFVVCLVASNLYHNSVIRTFVLRRRLEFLSMNDELTKLANRRSLNEYIELCWMTATRSGGAVGALMIDIDFFKRFNDCYGHQAGDRCLVQVAGAIEGCATRKTDMTARYGGEEFVVLLSHSSQQEAELIAARILERISALGIAHSGNPPLLLVTCSIGVAVKVPARGEHYELLLRQADDALYRAKQSGRNRYCVYSEE